MIAVTLQRSNDRLHYLDKIRRILGGNVTALVPIGRGILHGQQVKQLGSQVIGHVRGEHQFAEGREKDRFIERRGNSLVIMRPNEAQLKEREGIPFLQNNDCIILLCLGCALRYGLIRSQSNKMKRVPILCYTLIAQLKRGKLLDPGIRSRKSAWKLFSEFRPFPRWCFEWILWNNL